MNFKSLELKSIKENFSLDVYLNNLGDINYFAGESNSGKSLLLEVIYSTKENIGMIKDSPSFAQFWDNSVENWHSLVDKNLIILDAIDYKQATTDDNYTDIDQEVKIAIEEFGHYETDFITKGKDTNPNAPSTAIKKIYNLFFWIIYLYLNKGVKQFTIDEPECHLHPYITKTIPLLLEYLSNRYDMQFFVATHSPFILSSVSRITYEETQIKQTVYFLKDGQLIDKYGLISRNASSGYWGQKLIPIANTLLGSGIEDLLIEQPVEPTKDSPVLVLCEGENGDEDARIYNIIFHELYPRCLFVSCKGSSQLYRSFQLLNQIKPGLSSNIRIYMIRDRDAEYKDQEAIAKWEYDHPNAKVLSKRAMECYLFSSETAKLLCKKFNIRIDEKKIQTLDILQHKIAQEVREGQKTSSYKESLTLALNRATDFVLDAKVPENIHYETLAGLITTNTVTYRELYQDIFQ
jgi:hypothetical protein